VTVLPEELAWMRSMARERLGSRAIVLRATQVDTETGTRTDWLPVTPGVAAGVRDPTIGSETVLAGRIQSGTVVTVQLPLQDDLGHPVEVRAQDRLAVTVTDPISRATLTATMEVTGVAGRFSEWPILQRVVCAVMQ
jgi:hypothetical protein